MQNARKGRGAVTNASGRYERHAREDFDDGWTAEDPEATPLETIVLPEAAKTIIQRNDSPDISMEQTINPYRGCEHGCIYCFARPNHAYVGLSPGLDFESRLFFKPDAAKLLERELSAKNYRPRTIVIGAVTDPYQPIERRYRITRSLIEVLQRFNHPMGLITKSQLVLRDLDLLSAMGAQNLARVAVSLTTLDRHLARIMEPRAATPHRRLKVIRQLTAAGVPVTVMTAPIIPAVNDSEMEALLTAAAEAGATHAGFVMLRLPLEIADLFTEWLQEHFPDRKEHVLSLMRQLHGGKLYNSEWGVRARGRGPYARLMSTRFTAACIRLGLNKPRPPQDTSKFRKPPERDDQLDLLRDLGDA